MDMDSTKTNELLFSGIFVGAISSQSCQLAAYYR